MFTLRDYQRRVVDKAVSHIRGSGKNLRPVIVAPTAAGKSIIIAQIAKEVGGKILVLQPTKELLEQNVSKYHTQTGVMPDIYSASAGQKTVGDVTYATIGSIKNIGFRFRGYRMIVDECHLYPPGKSSMFGKFRDSAGIESVLGLTATPFRLKPLRGGAQLNLLTRMRPKVFTGFLDIIQISEMTDRGYWSPLKYYKREFDSSMLEVNSSGSEYTDKSLDRFYDANNFDHVIVRTVKFLREEHSCKNILVFVPSVDQAMELSARTSGSGYVHGKMKKGPRRDVIEGFKNGGIEVVYNVNVLSVGFDHPGIDGIVVARPTMSLAWYYQALGRGTRIKEGKERCIICDLSGGLQRFGKIENLVIGRVPGFGDAVTTTGGRILTNVPMSWGAVTAVEANKMKYVGRY